MPDCATFNSLDRELADLVGVFGNEFATSLNPGRDYGLAKNEVTPVEDAA